MKHLAILALLLTGCAYQDTSSIVPEVHPGAVQWFFTTPDQVAKLCGDPTQHQGCYLGKDMIVTRLPEGSDDSDLANILKHEIAHAQGWKHADNSKINSALPPLLPKGNMLR